MGCGPRNVGRLHMSGMLSRRSGHSFLQLDWGRTATDRVTSGLPAGATGFDPSAPAPSGSINPPERVSCRKPRVISISRWCTLSSPHLDLVLVLLHRRQRLPWRIASLRIANYAALDQPARVTQASRWTVCDRGNDEQQHGFSGRFAGQGSPSVEAGTPGGWNHRPGTRGSIGGQHRVHLGCSNRSV